MPSQVAYLTKEQKEFLEETVAEDPTIQRLAEELGTTPESAGLNFCLSQVALHRYGEEI